MININNQTISKVFKKASQLWPEAPFFISPQNQNRSKIEISYRDAHELSNQYSEKLRQCGYGLNQRIAVLLGNSPHHYIIKLALNCIGVSCVPLNPESSPSEIAFILKHSESVLIITDKQWSSLIDKSKAINKIALPRVYIDEFFSTLPASTNLPPTGKVNSSTESSLLYTSGTTGEPKGCILSNEYELMCGESYCKIGSPVALEINNDRIYNPLPSYHVNAGILSFLAVVLTGNCLIQSERFSMSNWWKDIADTETTIFHYLGVIIAVILSDKTQPDFKMKNLKCGFGAGVEPALHVEFESRFKIPLIECWGMTEMCRVLALNEEPRMINTRAFGKPRNDLKVKVFDKNNIEVPRGQPGEMAIRHSTTNPRKGFFSGYLRDSETTEKCWKENWFHTGDTVIQNQNGTLFFVDRLKNIIRRAGENIAAAEIENHLLKDPRITNVACIAVPDSIREEEIMACIVLSNMKLATSKTAHAIFKASLEEMAYFKAPGYILFLTELPKTGTQKVLKHKIFNDNHDPRKHPNVFDFRKLKKRTHR